jgi:hypothetical protein
VSPFDATNEDFLTQFLVDAGVRLHTSILVDALEARRVTLEDDGTYKKECVSSTAEFIGEQAQVVIALCHGWERGAYNSASLLFKCNTKRENSLRDFVFGKQIGTHDQHGNRAVTLHEVIEHSKLAILLTCNGDQLLQDYVYEDRKDLPHPDVLIYNGQALRSVVVEIYMVLLVNILDSELNLKSGRDMYVQVREAIKRIFQIVKVFGDDHASFWAFLQHVGCVTDNADEKDRQELPYPAWQGDEPFFRVYGRVYANLTGDFPEVALQHFKRIQLVTWNEADGKNEVIDCATVRDIKWRTSKNDKIYRFLKRYQRPVARAAAAGVVAPVATAVVCDVGEDVKHKLAILKRMYAL